MWSILTKASRVIHHSGSAAARTKIRYLRHRLLDWYKENGRNYPWRGTKDPYKILIAEIMLRRTRADQVVPIYKDFIKRYPTIKSLSEANQKDLQKLTHPLGLHWRNKRFQDLARYIISECDAKIPKEREELTKLPGVGEYVASVFLCARAHVNSAERKGKRESNTVLRGPFSNY